MNFVDGGYTFQRQSDVSNERQIHQAGHIC